MKAKFDNCALRVLAARPVAALYETIDGFEQLADVRAVSNAMATASPATATRGKATV